MATPTEMEARILNHVEEDGDFRSRPIADPTAAVSVDFGWVFHRDSRLRCTRTVHLVLPPSPELTEAEL